MLPTARQSWLIVLAGATEVAFSAEEAVSFGFTSGSKGGGERSPSPRSVRICLATSL
jgi:hypothetical protein